MDNLRKTIKTPIGIYHAAYAVKSALEFYGIVNNPEAAAKLLAQSILETGNFKYMYNYNWGNKKRSPDKGAYFMIRCSEIIDGKEVFFDPPHLQTCFASYENHTQGAMDWAKLILTGKNYNKSREYLTNKEVSAYDFAFQLGLDHYYTANKNKYASGVQNLYAKAYIAVGNSSTYNDNTSMLCNNLNFIDVGEIEPIESIIKLYDDTGITQVL